MRHKLAMIADGKLPPDRMRDLVELQEEAVERAAKGAGDPTPIERADREDAMADWLDDHGVRGAYDLAPVFVGGGLDPDWAETITTRVPDNLLEGALRWIAYTVETESLMREIEDSISRISSLLGAAKQYSQMDRAPFQPLDVHAGLDSTLIMMTSKLKGVRVVKDYATALPEIAGYAAELNQVWTNLVDNAAAAMAGEGELVVRTMTDGDHVVVEVQDSGPGIPAELRDRVFEPFFTTKAIGEGTGLGLDISWRIVVKRHHGDLRVRSRPGETVFTVRLPVSPPA
jgi:signal transduction histidine kinase